MLGCGTSPGLLELAVTVNPWLSPPPALIPPRFTVCTPASSRMATGLPIAASVGAMFTWPVPWIEKSYVPSSWSSVAMVSIAVRIPPALGSNVTWNVVLPPAATGELGRAVTVKSTACVPLTATLGAPVRVSAAVPLLVIVNIRTTVALVTLAPPKSV